MLTVVVTALLPSGLVATNAEGVDTPYALVPAGAEAVTGRVSYGDLPGGVEADTDPAGSVLFVTVSEPAQSTLGYWVSRIEPEIRFMTHEEKYPRRQTPAEQRRASLQMMATSAQVAQYVALTRAGFGPTIEGQVIVNAPMCAEATEDRCVERAELRPELRVDDIIAAVDGTEVSTVEEIAAALAGRVPGERVRVTIERGGEEPATVELELVPSPTDPEVGIIGFEPGQTVWVSLPFEVDIDTGEIGGPSAGLAFSLTLVDELTGGDLLGGHDVAVTGTIDLDGDVGAIGGIVQKASAVRQAGVPYFLVPAGQRQDDLDAAREVAGDDVEIIPVATFDEAISALERIGGDPPDVLVS